MRPKDLTISFEWKSPKIGIEEAIFFANLVEGWESFSFPGWRDPLVFGNDRPVKIEFCSGNGAWIAERARRFPDINWVALEKRFVRVRKIWSKRQNGELDNLFTICGEALFSTSCYLPSLSVSEAFINFPDPWPKKKHAKYRLIRQPFLQELWRVLGPSGRVTVVTDHSGYSEQIVQEFAEHRGFMPLFQPFGYITDWPEYGDSYFNALWRGQGAEIRYMQFEKRPFLR